MKKIYLMTMFALAGIVSFGQTNLDFETWSGTPLLPDGWVPYSAEDSVAQTSAPLNLEGTHSMQVANTNFQDVSMNDSLGGSWISQVMSVAPDSLKIACAPVVMGTDTAEVLIYTISGGSYSQLFYIDLHAGNTTIGNAYTLTFDLTSAATFDAIEVVFYSSKSPSNSGTFIIVDDVQIFQPSGAGLGQTDWSAINVYPNPATSTINFSLGDAQVDQIQIMDISGRIVDNVVVTGTLETLELSNYQNGVYFYQMVKGDAVVKTDKFIVSK